MFEDGFKEGQQLQVVLEDMEGVVSVQSLEPSYNGSTFVKSVSI